MKVKDAKEAVILAGKRLVESGLIARTWGNVSCRISDSHFVITPSGREYLSLTPEEIVEVAVSDCSYSGDIKPSSEKGVHAEVYKLFPEVNFVIHTHQNQASSLSVLMLDSIPVSLEFSHLKGEVICASYGLPGTKKLRHGVKEALSRSKGNAVIMKNHGALCFGTDSEEAFKVALELEDACSVFLQNQYTSIAGKPDYDPFETGCLALSKLTQKSLTALSGYSLLKCESERIENGFRIHFGDKTYDILDNRLENISVNEINMLEELKIHSVIYNNHTGINNIIHANTSGIASVSCAGIKLLPLLDDFAQIAGTQVKSVKMDTSKISAALKSSSAVIIEGNGILCCGASKSDALAVGMVVEKNCNALIGAAMFGKIKYINRFESALMRFIYLKKYSKQAYVK